MNAKVLQRASSSISRDSIDTVETISAQDFRNGYIKANRPLKMTKMMSDWPAMHRWNFDFFRALGSSAEVHLEEGNVMQEETGFRKETFSDYVEALMQDDGQADRKSYLSVFRIFDTFPELRKDVDFSIIDQHKIKSSISGWIGPAGTVTGYHIDWGDNILAQICGRKCVHLAAPSQTPNMYASKKFDQGTTISRVDLHSHDRDEFPRFKSVSHKKVILDRGEMIFIPRGWWHHVESLDKSISVSNITYDAKGILVDAIPQRLKQIAHDLGLWKCDCTCHVVRNGKWTRR